MLVKRFQKRWQWEVAKMFMYMSFPVMCFHYFNTPQIFEEEVTKIKKLHYPPTSPEQREEIENMIREVNAKRELRALKEMEAAREQKKFA
ncbi:protein PET100 homolog, mitochondrial [Nasonia vitripennis]|uniref:Protein PET100 homolog, mitochondrial n=1 Tax=Nasonia vitripennis TaxID=7425 RepID=A0A7M7G5K2_NASVI|nr:protein PET100 homolog, mitochondrial [Nasonia vitripennis]